MREVLAPLNDLKNLQWAAGVIALPIGLITPFKTGGGPPCVEG